MKKILARVYGLRGSEFGDIVKNADYNQIQRNLNPVYEV